MERRLSVALAAAGLLAALGIFLQGRRTSSDDVDAAAADLEALIRENAAGAQARAETLAQLPRLGWAVATDENTMRDLTTEELAFRPHPGERIEITQMQKGGGAPRPLLRLPSESGVALPVLPGTHVVALVNQLHVVTVVRVEPRQRANEVVGILAVSKQIDTSAIEQRLAARGINAELRTIQGSITLAGSAPSAAAVEAKIALTGPAAEGAEIVAANVGRRRWHVAPPLILVLSLAMAGLLWRHGAAPPPATHNPFAAPPAAPPEPSASARSTAPTPAAIPAAADEWAASPSQVTPAIGNPLNPPGAAPQEQMDPERSGRVEISLVRSGSVSLSPRPPGAPAPAPDPAADADPRTEDYRALFAEFVKLRRTTGESVEGLDAAYFAETLREKRAQIMKQIPVKDVVFKLAFHNGKAAIRYLTVS